jgi:hypothetical protein
MFWNTSTCAAATQRATPDGASRAMPTSRPITIAATQAYAAISMVSRTASVSCPPNAGLNRIDQSRLPDTNPYCTGQELILTNAFSVSVIAIGVGLAGPKYLS